MIKNYFKVALRNLWKHRGYAALNIMGLAIGMAASFLIVLYLIQEMGYDRFHPAGERTYRVVTDLKTPSDSFQTTVLDWNRLEEFATAFPEIESYSMVMGATYDIKIGNDNYREELMAANEDFFTIFGYQLLEGNPSTALKDPLSMVLTESSAQRYFPDGNAMGKTFRIRANQNTVTVTGIMEDLPQNTMLDGNMILSISSIYEVIDPDIKESWANFESYGFAVLAAGTDAKVLEEKMAGLNQEKHGAQMESSQLTLEYFLEPIEDIHLYSARGQSPQITNIYIFAIVALFILCIAAINFINLTTARSVERAKEVGIRKVIGAQRGQLASQFLSESLVVCLLSFVLALGITAAALPYFNTLAGSVVATSIFGQPYYILSLLVVAIIIAVAAGSYPAIILSSYKPIKVLKGKFSNSSSGEALRKGLVISQFTISLVMIISTIIVYNQTVFMRGQDLGFEKEQLLVIPTDNSSKTKLFKQKLATIPQITSISTSSNLPGNGGDSSTALSLVKNKSGQNQTLSMSRYIIDHYFIDQLGMKIIAGRNFSKEFATDSTSAMILNRKAVNLLGYANAQDAIGASFEQWGRNGVVVGVVQDFHMESLQDEIEPLSMVYSNNSNLLVNIKVAGSVLNNVLPQVEQAYKSVFIDKSYDYFFLDEDFDEQYRSEDQFARLSLNFAFLAIFISCLGLLGLASYSTLQRKREIGIRKVLGASSAGIVNLMSLNFLKLVGIAILIASPIAWYLMHNWLADFAYRIDIGIWVFVGAGLIAMTIAVVTVAGQAIKAAIANPVDSLKTE
ncbi:MAG: ABC transporter permease [Nonlabens sp.]